MIEVLCLLVKLYGKKSVLQVAEITQIWRPHLWEFIINTTATLILNKVVHSVSNTKYFVTDLNFLVVWNYSLAIFKNFLRQCKHYTQMLQRSNLRIKVAYKHRLESPCNFIWAFRILCPPKHNCTKSKVISGATRTKTTPSSFYYVKSQFSPSICQEEPD